MQSIWKAWYVPSRHCGAVTIVPLSGYVVFTEAMWNETLHTGYGMGWILMFRLLWPVARCCALLPNVSSNHLLGGHKNGEKDLGVMDSREGPWRYEAATAARQPKPALSQIPCPTP